MRVASDFLNYFPRLTSYILVGGGEKKYFQKFFPMQLCLVGNK